VSELAKTLQLPQPKLANADSYSVESALMQSRRIIPLLHLRRAVALRSNVRGLNISPLGEWRIENVWMSNASLPNASIPNASLPNGSLPNASLPMGKP
jgi:MarR-like DNA-binding transcriptional regulator SgrR of sgrS sRNA